MIRPVLIALTILSLGACAGVPRDQQGGRQRDRGDVIGARNAAVQLCGPGNVRQAPGTDGTRRSDYYCGDVR